MLRSLGLPNFPTNKGDRVSDELRPAPRTGQADHEGTDAERLTRPPARDTAELPAGLSDLGDPPA